MTIAALTFLDKILKTAWDLLDAVSTPPWLRGVGMMSVAVWIGCIIYDSTIVTYADPIYSMMGFLHPHGWITIFFALFVVIAWSFVDPAQQYKRMIALSLLSVYWLTLGPITLWKQGNRVIGWHFIGFGLAALLAVFRPVIERGLIKIKILLRVKGGLPQ